MTATHPRFPTSLREELEGDVIGPDDPGYDQARAVFMPSIDRRPVAVVRPVDAVEAARVVAHARDAGLELAVRGGGHSVAGHGASEGGIVLDLSLMKGLAIHPERRVVWAEGGLTAGEVTDGVGAHDLAVPFGDTGSVGIGGLTLGGGVGYLARRHGLTIDSLLAAELVTADGAILDVDAENHPDLFWALRGGGGNFGVVTRFRYRLHPVGTVTGGMLALPATPATIAELVAAADAAPDDVSAIVNVMSSAPMPFVPEEHRDRPLLLATIVHAGSTGAAERDLAPFRAIARPVVDMLRPLPYPELFPAEEAPFRASARNLYLDRVDAEVGERVLEALETAVSPFAAVQLRVLGGAVARVPADATAYAHRASRIMANVAAAYPLDHDPTRYQEWTREVAESLRQDDPAVYVNFLGDEGPERLRAAYPEETWSRLAAVKRRYDPDNVFHVNHNVPAA